MQSVKARILVVVQSCLRLGFLSLFIPFCPPFP
uniref:Uncharacterized protein n=1 Tax=Siphoviridae sp. ctXPH7 TaxID=2826367 RepID=A0A8S5LYM6_9CAUD|nr:MAG TPA: hypothetical protein [Siphoviridae sp. ctXPH7]